jgi:type VI secretion system protein ImpG
MRDELLWYYERELGYLRRLGAEFARRYPKIAGRLLLEPTKCEDPHVERLLEGFAFLAARIHLKLDDDFPEVAEAMLGVVAPQLARPVPSVAIAEFQLDPERARRPGGVTVPRGTALETRAVGGVRCAFRTTADATLWPAVVADARWTTPDALDPPLRAGDAVGALRLVLRGFPEVPLGSVPLDAIRLFLHADGALPATLYEVLCGACTAVLVRPLDADGGGDPRQRVTLPGSAVRPAGFAEDERLLPGAGGAFAPYALLQDYFALPESYLFVDLAVGAAVRAVRAGTAVEIVCLVGPFERAERRQALATGVSADVVRTGCVPAVNLFAQAAEPILLTHKRDEYPLVADARRRHTTHVYAVDRVVGVTPGEREPVRFEPLYGLRHHATDGAADGPAGGTVFWTPRRRLVPGREDGATEVTLAFVDRASRTVRPAFDVASARVTCHNGDLPARLPVGDPRGDFEPAAGGPFARVVARVKPTEPVHPPFGKPLLWRLVSHLSLNHLSLVDGPDALRELLRLYNPAGSPGLERQIQGVVDVRSAAAHARVAGPLGAGVARGRRVEVEFDEEHFTGGGAYLFASVLERFLARYASMNSFTQLVARTRQRQRPMRAWAPRAGTRELV